jgi:hypothetical protein
MAKSVLDKNLIYHDFVIGLLLVTKGGLKLSSGMQTDSDASMGRSKLADRHLPEKPIAVHNLPTMAGQQTSKNASGVIHA